ncbi:MAG: sugar O-acetyltransferase [Clostridiales bacterium]|nr:sugar O-acetyltransferase [Clostridiales bacterium]
MTKKEKMIAGEYYVGMDEELTAERERAKDLLFEFNSAKPSLRAEREALLQKLFGKLGKNSWVESPFNCDYGGNLYVGDNFYANTNLCILDCAKVTIGNNVFIGPNVGIYPPEHAFDKDERAKGYERALPVEIGDDVWICGSVSIKGGVRIGSGSIIGMGSVVITDIPSGVIAAGNPARVIRKITDADKCEFRRPKNT